MDRIIGKNLPLRREEVSREEARFAYLSIQSPASNQPAHLLPSTERGFLRWTSLINWRFWARSRASPSPSTTWAKNGGTSAPGRTWSLPGSSLRRGSNCSRWQVARRFFLRSLSFPFLSQPFSPPSSLRGLLARGREERHAAGYPALAWLLTCLYQWLIAF